MKAILIIMICAMVLELCNTFIMPNQGASNISVPDVDTNYFRTHLQPILKKNCSPCHFPGGKMYAKMPFDKGQTIISHEAGILKRIKAENELAVLKEFLRQNKTTSSTGVHSIISIFR